VFATLDWIIVAIYACIVVGIGIATRRSSGLRGFLLADGAMPWWAVGISLIATSVSTTSLIGSPAEAYQFDLRYLSLHAAVPLSLLLVTVIFIPWFRRRNIVSAYEALEERFDLKTRLLASSLYILHVLLRTGILIFGPALVLSRFMGISVEATIVVVGAVAIAYSALGGLRAVIWTDVLQFVALVGGAIGVCMVIEAMIPGGFRTIWQVATDAGKTRVIDMTMDVGDPRTFISAGVAYLALDLAIRSTDQQFIQRYLSCASVGKAQLSALLSAVLGLGISILFFGMGLHLWAFYQFFPAGAQNLASPNEVLPAFASTHLPSGLAGLLIAGVFAAAMSSIDSAIAALSNTATVDFFLRLRKDTIDEKGRMAFARWSIAGFGVLGIAFALVASTTGSSLLHTALSFTSLFTGSLLGLFTLAVMPRPVAPTAAFIGAIAGAVALLGVNTFAKGMFSWPWWPVISFTVTVVVGMLLSLLLRRPQLTAAP